MADKYVVPSDDNIFSAQNQGKALAEKQRYGASRFSFPDISVSQDTRDRLFNVLMGGTAGVAAAQGAIDPIQALALGVGGGLGATQAQDVRAAQQKTQQELAIQQLDITPVGQVSPQIVQALQEKYGMDISDIPMGQFQKFSGLIQRSDDLEQQNAAFQRQLALMEARFNLGQPKEAAKLAKEDKELSVPGYTLTGEVRPLPAEAKELRTGTAAVKDFTKGVDRLKALIGKYGSTNVVGKGSGEMRTLTSNLKLTLKEVQKLGVLSSSDIAFLEDQLFNPAEFKSWGTRTSTALEQLDTIKSRAESGVAEALKSRGYAPVGGGGETRKQVQTQQGPRIGVWDSNGKFLRYE